MVDGVERPVASASYVFISYASADRERVLPVVAALERAGVPVWIDRVGIATGANYGEQIAQAIKGAAALVLMTSAASLASRNVKQEVALAWEHERPYVPLLLETVTIPIDLQYWLTAAQWTEVLDHLEGTWLPAVLAALAPLGIHPVAPATEEIHLAGRERELAVLREKVAATKEGTGGLVLIGGEAGIGKTTLAEVVCNEAARQGCVVLEGHCFDLAETPPYGPWIDLFLRFPLVPGGPPLPSAFAERGTVGAVPSQMALFAQVQDFLDALMTRQPVVMLLDDLHWSDPASLDLLRFLARSVATRSLLILVTYRSDELTRRHPLYQLLPQLAREAGAARLDVGSLDDDAVRALVTERYHLPDEATARLAVYLQIRAEGNALFVGELLRSLEEARVLQQKDAEWHLGDLSQTAVPALLRQVIDGRLARLEDESQRLLAVAAVIGQEVPLAVWAAVAEVDEEAALAVAEEGLEARLLVEGESGEAVRFAHALIRESLFEGIPNIRRRRIHRRVGDVLAEAGNSDPDAVAMHFQKAGDSRAVGWLVQAGERAQLAYAWLTAIARYEAALALLDGGDGDPGERGWLRYRAARLRRYSTPRESIEYLDDALRIAATVGDRALAAASRYTRGLCLFYEADYGAAIRDMAAGCDALEALPPDEQERLDLGPDAQGVPTITNPRGLLVLALALSGRIAEAIVMGEATREGIPRHTPLGELGWAHHGDRYGGLAEAYANAGRPDASRDAYTRARDIFRALGNYSTLGAITIQELLNVSLPYRTEQTDEHWQLAEDAAVAWGRASASGERGVRSAYIPVLMLTGRWLEARAEAEAVMQAATRAGRRHLVPTLLGELAGHQGDREAAWKHIYAVLPDGPRTVPGTHSLRISLAVTRLAAALLLDAEDVPHAREWLEANDRWLTWSGMAFGQSEGQALWAQYHRQIGDMEQSREHAERALAHATEPRQPLALLAAHRLIGELDTDAGRHEDAARHLAESLAIADACQAPFERALTLLAMAEWRAARGETDAANTLLEDVRAICTPLGAKPTLARADAIAKRIATKSA